MADTDAAGVPVIVPPPLRLTAVVALEAVMAVLHPNPVFVVQFNALPAVEHVPTAKAVGEAVPLVAFPTTVLVA